MWFEVPLPFFLRDELDGLGWSRPITGLFLALFIIVYGQVGAAWRLLCCRGRAWNRCPGTDQLHTTAVAHLSARPSDAGGVRCRPKQAPTLFRPALVTSPMTHTLPWAQIQSWTPQLVLTPLRQMPANKYVAVVWNALLVVAPLCMAAVLQFGTTFRCAPRRPLLPAPARRLHCVQAGRRGCSAPCSSPLRPTLPVPCCRCCCRFRFCCCAVYHIPIWQNRCVVLALGRILRQCLQHLGPPLSPDPRTPHSHPATPHPRSSRDVPGMTTSMVLVLAAFCVLFAVNSSIHSYLVVRYADGDKVAMNVGFYYMANAIGRLVGARPGWLRAALCLSCLGLPCAVPGVRCPTRGLGRAAMRCACARGPCCCRAVRPAWASTRWLVQRTSQHCPSCCAGAEPARSQRCTGAWRASFAAALPARC
jgi:hypothetical protein